MQPYFFPYYGYFQLISLVDQFVIYDDIKYTKKGWINRNRILVNGQIKNISLPLKKGSDSLDIKNRTISPDFNKKKLLNQIYGAYSSAPHFESAFQMVEKVLLNKEENLFNFLYSSLEMICNELHLDTKFVISSKITEAMESRLKGEQRVLSTCLALGASEYINLPGGTELYCVNNFNTHKIKLSFIKPNIFEYPQSGLEFIPSLSIIDVMMFNSIETIRQQLLRKAIYL